VHLGFFLAWCHDRGITEPTEVTRPILEHYQRYLYHYRQKNGRPLSFRSQHTRLVPIRVWFRWLARQHHILHNPASELELPRLEHRLPQSVLTVAEMEQVLAQPDIRDPLGLRDRALMETLYSTGMRRLELANLKLYDLDTERGTVTIRQGKGKKDRVIPIGERAAAWVEKYIRELRPKLVVEPDDHTVFLSNAGEPFCLDHLSDLVRTYVDAANIGKRGACHMFRHVMATLMLENGADIRYIQQMLGHADLKTTQIYTQVSIRQLKRIHAATHPAAQLEKEKASPPAAAKSEEASPGEANRDRKDKGDE
jgi:integrase/recombinase XerD